MKGVSVMRDGQQIVRSLRPSKLSSELSGLARNDQVNCRCSIPAGPQWLFNLMSYCRRPLERDVYTATGFRAANDRPFMLNEFAGRAPLLPVYPVSRLCEHAWSFACTHARALSTRICDATPPAGISMPWRARNANPLIISRHFEAN